MFFLIYGTAYLLLFLYVKFFLKDHSKIDNKSTKEKSKVVNRKNTLKILTTSLIFVLLFTGSSANGSLLTLYADDLFSSWAIAAVISIGPIFEIIVLPLIGMVNDRIGTKKTMQLGGIGGVIYFCLLAINNDFYLLLFVQIFGTLYSAMLFTSLMIYIQETFKDRVGFASSVYFSGMSISTIAGRRC